MIVLLLLIRASNLAIPVGQLLKAVSKASKSQGFLSFLLTFFCWHFARELHSRVCLYTEIYTEMLQ